MKMIGMVISLLLVAVLVVLQWKSLTGGDDPPPITAKPPDARFINRCRELAPPKLLRADDYCKCLWQRGVRKMTHLVTDPQAKHTAETCKALQQPVRDSGV